jgi:mRNA-degrading endonuclease toxin of MazEF toxin-antitoxin module
MAEPRQGDVLRVTGDEEEGHFAIVVSQERFNRGTYVVAVPVTSK